MHRKRLARCLAIVALLASQPVMASGAAAPAVWLENPVTVRARFPAGDATVPAVVAATALPRIHSSVETAPSVVVSEDTRISREDLGPDVLPTVPFPWAATLRVQCASEDVNVINDGAFLGSYANWSALPLGTPTPDGWQGAHVTTYYQGGAVVFPSQPDRPGGRLVTAGHTLSDHPVLPRSSCGQELDSGLIADFHRVTLTAEAGDVTFKAGDDLGSHRMRMLPGWRGAVFGWFDPPGKELDVTWRRVTNAQTGEDQLRLDIATARPGRWRESLPTPQGRTWEWSVSGFNLFDATEQPGGGNAGLEARAALRVLPGQTIVRLRPEGGRIVRSEYVSPGFGAVVVKDDVLRFVDLLRPSALPSPAAGAADSLVAATGPLPTGASCTRSIDGHWEEARLCMALGAVPGGFSGLTHLSIDEHVDRLTGALTHVEAGGVRREVLTADMVNGPLALEYQYESGDGPGTILSLDAAYAVGDARFVVSWLFINDGVYGRLLAPMVVGFRSPSASTAAFSWYARPTLGGEARTRVRHGWTGAPIERASTWHVKGGFLTGTEWFELGDAETGSELYYVPSGAGHRWSALAWVSHDSSTTFLGWSGRPSPSPSADAVPGAPLGDDVAVYKQDLIESFYMARAYGGSYGMLVSTVPFLIGFV